MQEGPASKFDHSGVNHAIHVRCIRVEFEDLQKTYPVFIQIKANNDTYRSRYYRKDEDTVWTFEKGFTYSSILAISIKERHRIRPNKDIAKCYVAMENLYQKPIFLIEGMGGKPITLKIECEASGPFVDVIKRLVEESQKRLSNMKVFLERLGKVCEVLNCIANITHPVAEAYPAVQTAVGAVTVLYEACRRQQEVHEAASDLMADIASFLPFTEIPVDHTKSAIAQSTAYDMLVLFEKIARSIIKYSSGTSLGDLLGDRIDEINCYKDNFRKLKETLDWCIKTETWKTVLKIETHAEHLLLARLHPVLQVFYDTEKSCFEGTRRDTIQTIRQWSSSDSKLLWLYGAEGTGKTTIAHTVGRIFDEEDRLAGCFFCRRTNRERRQPERIMPTLAYQLAKWHAEYRSIVLDVLEGRDERNVHTGLRSQFDLLFKGPLTKLPPKRLPPKHRPLIIVLDALDECCDSIPARRLLVDYVDNIASIAPWLKIFVSSRKPPEFEGCFNRDGYQHICIGDPPLDLQREIALYVEQAQGSGPVLQSSNGGQNSGSPSIKRPAEDWSRIDELFHRFIRGIADKQSYDGDMMPLVIDIFAVISCVTVNKALTEDAVLHFLKPFHPELTPDAFHTAVSSLRPLIFPDSGGRLQVIFPLGSFSDFISDRNRSGWFYVDMSLVNVRIAHKCLDTMDTLLRFNICNLESSYIANQSIQDLESKIRTNVSEGLQYSSLYWMDHLLRTDDTQTFRNALAGMLCSPKALYWIEVLSLLDELEAGKHILSKCVECFKADDQIVRATTELTKFIHDFFPAMASSTPHIYVSALSWLPSDSPILNHVCGTFRWQSPVIAEGAAETSEPRNAFWIVSKTEGRDWNPTVFMNAVRHSPDGRRIISGEDGTLQIWDAQTGIPIRQLLGGHSRFVSAVGYSRDGKKVVSGSEDGTLRIWDADSGTQIGVPFGVNASSISAVEYSPDGSRIVSAGSILQIWNAQTSEPICSPRMVLVGNKCYNINAVRYSPDGSEIASGCLDRTVRIWDAQNGVQVGNPFKGHFGSVNAVAYSPDGRRIVSGSDDEALIIWDAHTGDRIGNPLRGHRTAVTSVEYALDGSTIISGSPDGTLIIWDAQSGIQVDQIHRGEERWDPDKQCYKSIPNWWPELIAPSSKSIIRSPGRLEMSNDGWVRTLNGSLFLWVPPRYRPSLQYLSRTSTSGASSAQRLKLDWRNLHVGREWTTVMREA